MQGQHATIWTNADPIRWRTYVALGGGDELTLEHLSLLSGVPDYFDRNKISSGGDLSHYSSASLY